MFVVPFVVDTSARRRRMWEGHNYLSKHCSSSEHVVGLGWLVVWNANTNEMDNMGFARMKNKLALSLNSP